jgi:hypothetical protein
LEQVFSKDKKNINTKKNNRNLLFTKDQKLEEDLNKETNKNFQLESTFITKVKKDNMNQINMSIVYKKK